MARALELSAAEPEARPVVSMNPATGEVWAEFAAMTPDAVVAAIQNARAAQADWATLGLQNRSQILSRLHENLFTARREMATLITRECGKPASEALIADVVVALDLVSYYLKRSDKLLRPKHWRHQNLSLKLKRAEMVYQPWGVVGVITPWNYPLMLVMGAVFPALLAGNSVVLKPAEYTTSTALKLAELAHAAGVPKAVFQVLPGDGRTGAALIENGVDKIVFVGSERAGRKVAAAAAERLIPVTLELGGSDPMLVLRDAPVAAAAASAIWGRFSNAGQTCVAVKRVFVDASIYEPFVERVLAGVHKLRLGPGSDPDIDVGPMIRESQIVELERQLQDAIDHGARIRFGGRRRTDIGPLFFEPTVLTEVTPEMAVLREETFGPLLPIMLVRDVEEAVHMANASRYGLSASIWSRDRQLARKLARQIQAGSVTINDAAFHPGACDVPYGGFKNSGLGKSHGDAGLLDMVKAQYIDTDLVPQMYKPWWYAYSKKSLQKIDQFGTFLHSRSLWARLRAIPASVALLWHRNRI